MLNTFKLIINNSNFIKKSKHLLNIVTTKMNPLESVGVINKISEEKLCSLKLQFSEIKNEKINRKKILIKNENIQLEKQIAEAKELLIKLEIANGKQQIPLPNNETKNTETISKEQSNILNEIIKKSGDKQDVMTAEGNNNSSTVVKEKKVKNPPKENAKTAQQNEPPIDVGRLDLRVGKIIDVKKHPDADSLYLEKIDCGEEQPRTVVSGLVKFIPMEQMQNRMVIVLCNLKPAKMRGVTSEAMVMCASTAECVEILCPPEGSIPGDLVHCNGYVRQPDSQMNPKKKIWETVAPDLHTNDSMAACYKGVEWNVPGKGVINAQTLKNVIVK